MELDIEPWVANLLIVVVTAGSMIITAVSLFICFEVGVALDEVVDVLRRADREASAPPTIPISEQERLRREAVEANNYRIFVGQYGYP